VSATVRKSASREASRHPRNALFISMFLLRHRKALLAAKRTTEHAERSVATARRVVGDPGVHREAQQSVSAMVLAKKRALKVGFVRAPGDKKVAAHLRRSGQHASRAMLLAERARRNRSNHHTVVLVVAGVGAVGVGAAYAGWRAYFAPEPATVPPAYPGPDVGEPSAESSAPDAS
jgi:hypothetical protein